ncbi:MAG: outer membrane beta-barrel protein [Saprospiraceae bacterium]
MDIKADYEVTSLEIPVLGKVKFGSESLKFYALVGPSFGFGTGGKIKSEGSIVVRDDMGGLLFETPLDAEAKAKFVKNGYDLGDVNDDEFAASKTNFNLHLGAGLGFDLGGASLFLDARYILGLSDLSPEPKDTAKEDEVTIKSRRIGVSVGVMFPLN